MADQETNAGVDDGKNEQDNNDNKGATTEDASEPTEQEKPKKKLILKPEDRIKLGKQLEPLLKPALKSLVLQLEAAEKVEEAEAATAGAPPAAEDLV